MVTQKRSHSSIDQNKKAIVRNPTTLGQFHSSEHVAGREQQKKNIAITLFLTGAPDVQRADAAQRRAL